MQGLPVCHFGSGSQAYGRGFGAELHKTTTKTGFEPSSSPYRTLTKRWYNPRFEDKKGWDPLKVLGLPAIQLGDSDLGVGRFRV